MPAPALRRRHAPQGGVLAQPADHHQPQRQDRLEKRLLGIAAIDHQPQGFAALAQPPHQPADQHDGQFQLGVEGPGLVLGQLQDILEADVEQGLERPSQGVPGAMMNQPGQGDPEVAVDELLAGRAGRGVVMDAGALDPGSVTRGRGVVDGEEPAFAG